MSEWKEYKFSQLCDISRGASPRPIQKYLTKNEGMPWVKIADATSNSSKYITHTNENIKLDGVDKSVKVYKGDLILSNSATPGLPKIMGIDACIHDGWMLLRNFKNITKEFTYWLLLNERKKLVHQGNGSVFINLKTDILKSHIVKIPDIKTQNKIVLILDQISNKIELNTQTNQTLEQIAQATFKHWFIDFTPVHAKANALARGETIEQAELAAMACLSGKTVEKITALKTEDPTAYHQLQQTAAAFPSEFVETEMGQVPKGWGYKFLNEVCKIAYGKNLPTKQLLDQGYPVFGGNGIIGYFDRYLYEQPQTLISCRGAASGKIMYSAPKSFITNNSLIIESNELLDYFYIYEYLKNKDITPYISGSAQPQITISSIEKIKILLPQEFILNRYSLLVSSLYNKIYLNNKNNELLAKTRDQLLPKLLNGEVEL